MRSCRCSRPSCPICRSADAVVHVDYAIVGAGTAGCPLAFWLSADRRTRVHVGNAGVRANDDPLVLGTDTDALDAEPQYHLYSQTIVSPIGAIGPLFSYSNGAPWGGSSAHNYLVAVRPTPSVCAAWVTLSGDARWAYAAQRPAMLYMETYTPNADDAPADPAERGADGPLFITESPPPVGDADLLAALAANAMPALVDYNDPTGGAVGVGTMQRFVHPSGTVRSWAASSWLGPTVVDADGRGVAGRRLTVTSNAVALRILFADDLDPSTLTDPAASGSSRATGCAVPRERSCAVPRERSCAPDDPSATAVGVRYLVDDRIVDVVAHTRVILATGFADAALLQRSGIGPRALLESLDIDVRVANDNVGANIQDHVGFVAALAPTDPAGVLQLNAFSDLSGPNTGVAPSGERKLQLILAQGSPDLLLAICWLLRPPHQGVTTLKSAAFADVNLTDFHFYSTASEQEDVVSALKVVGNVSISLNAALPLSPPAALYPASEYAAYGGAAADDSELLAFAEDGPDSVVTNHASGACRMGTSAATGVVDGRLDVFGARRLSVCSNAVVPQINDGNTAYTAYLLGLAKAKIEGAKVPY